MEAMVKVEVMVSVDIVVTVIVQDEVMVKAVAATATVAPTKGNGCAMLGWVSPRRAFLYVYHLHMNPDWFQ